jgi:hypothetical protein
MREATNCAPILAALAADTSRIGLCHADLMAATGLTSEKVTRALEYLRGKSRLGRLGRKQDSRYFETPARAEECRADFEAFMVKLAQERRKRRLEVQSARQRRRYALQHGTPEKSPLEKKRSHAPVMMNRGPRKPERPRLDGPVVVPAHVKVTVCPSGRDARFSAPDGFVGEFVREWRERRA